MISRSVQRLLKGFMLAMLIAGMTLVPLWQTAGHATEIEHKAVAAQDIGADAVPDHFGSHQAGHHLTADHAHEVPMLRLASFPQAIASGDSWGLPGPSHGEGTEPYSPKQPPRPI